jgi:type II secretory pathway pseudopilin PulG
MAGKKISYTVRAATLLETVIAMIVIIVVFGIAMTIFNNVTGSSLSARKVQASGLLQDMLAKAEAAGEYRDTTFSVGDLDLYQTCKAFPEQGGLTEITLSATDSSRANILTIRKVVIGE